MFLLHWSLFCRGNFVEISISMHMCEIQIQMVCTYVGRVFLYILVLEVFTLSYYSKSLRWVSVFKTQNLSYITPWNDCHQLPKRGRLKASRPLNCVLVINDNHHGLTFLFRYKNRLVRRSVELMGYAKRKACVLWMKRSSRQRYKDRVFYFSGHEVIRGW